MKYNEDLLNKIHFIMERIVVFDGIDEVLDHIVKNAVALTRAEAGTLRTFDITTGKLGIKASFGLSKGFLSQTPLRIGEGIIGKVVKDGKPFMTSNLLDVTDCVHKKLAKKEGINSILSVPLKTSNKAIGCITVYRKAKEKFTNSELLLLNIFASQSTEAIEKLKLLEDLKRQASFDSLLDIYNRGFLLTRLEEEIKRASRHDLVFTAIFIDIDDFKKFNDTHGHLLGDKLLVDLTKLIKNKLRKNDIIGRYGGEEIVIIAPETDKKGGTTLIKKILKSVNHHSFTGSNGDIRKIGFCAGVSAYPEDGKTAKEIIGKADQAMYKAKKDGKNKVVVY